MRLLLFLPRKFALLLPPLLACCLLGSCGSSNIATTISKPYHAIADLIPRRVPIAEVRPGELQKMPTGADRARAWDRKLDARRYAYARKTYKAPKLPDSRSLPAGEGILPPIQPGPDTRLERRGDLLLD